MFDKDTSTRWYADEKSELAVSVGCQSWGHVVEWFQGMALSQITDELDRCFSEPRPELESLARRILSEMAK